MDMEKLLEFAKKPEPFQAGSAVMWTDPYISRQLLKFHLDPDHDAAGRRDSKIDHLVRWILSKVPGERMRILDLGCGPGLYAEKLAALGHRVTGVDFSKTSIEYAKENAAKHDYDITYIRGNYLDIDFRDEFDLALLIYLDFCVLKPEERKVVLGNVYKALKKGGVFIFDAVNGKNIEEKILKESWEAAPEGFWRDVPYIALNRGRHFPDQRALLNQHVVMTGDDEVASYLFWSIYYEYADLASILAESGFGDVRNYENVLQGPGPWEGENITFYSAKKI